MSGSRLYSSALLGPLAEQLVDAAGISSGMRVIDVLAGSGHLTRQLAVAVATAMVVAVERDGEASAALTAELRAAHSTAAVIAATPSELPYADDEFDVALSLLTLPGGEPGAAILREMQRVAADVVVVVNADERPAPEAMFAAAWRDVTGTVPESLRAPVHIQLPHGWSTLPVQDVARFDSADQLRTALLDHHALTAADDVLVALSSRFAELLQPFQAADGTLRIPVGAQLMRTQR